MTEFPESVKSERLALELTGLVSKTSGKVEADTGCHDDLALASAICMYVRKYDPPLMIGTDTYSGISNEMTEIMSMNTDSPNIKFDNRDIMKHVKEKYDELDGFVDTLSFFKE